MTSPCTGIGDHGKSAVLRGSLLMLAAAACFAILHGSVRHLSSEVHSFEIAFFRNLLGLFVVAPWFVTQGLRPLRTRRFGLHLMRASCNVAAMLMFFLALSMTPLAQVQALGFTAPLFATVLAVVILREKVRLRRWSALVAGFLGALIILRPGLEPVDLGSLLTLASAAVWGLTLVVIKVLSRTDSSITITAFMVMLMSPLSLVPALFFWVWPTPGQWFWLLVCGIAGTLAQLLMTESLRVADTSVVLPLDFTKIIWGALIGYVAFGELVDVWTWVGAVIIFSGATYITYRERQLARRAARRAREDEARAAAAEPLVAAAPPVAARGPSKEGDRT